ncbi:ATPase [Pantoea sp. EA-12]|uniref:ATPase n=1 Tax=Pantoea sp. EA-12 TaxID=3043303 RepID=UPI0024B4B725|nr:ATPase [Pantoea sp. EA-12]MDI9220486.1 ATPase [Pantoea sp. EA-12]
MTDKATPAAEGQLNKSENSVVQVEHESSLIYFRPDTEELVLLAESASHEFDEHWTDLLLCVDNHHKANENYSSLIEKYGLLYAQPDKKNQLSEAEKAVQKAQDELAATQKELSKRIGDFDSKGAGYKDVVELIPIKGTSNRGGRALAGSRYVYVQKTYYDDLGAGKRHNVKISGKDRTSAGESIYQNGRVDLKKLRKQLTDLKIPKPKKQDVKLPKPADFIDIDKTLVEWAGSWNDCLGSDENGKPHSIDISAGAQFLRFTSNVGMSGKWDPNNGKVSYKGEASAVVNVASGTVNAKCFYPDRVGWPLKYEPESSSPIDMGMLRLILNTDLVGFVGASVQAEAQLQVTTFMSQDGIKQVLTGKKSDKLPRFTERRTTGAKFQKQMNDNDEGVSINAEAFGGARAEAFLKGSMQWLEPLSSLDQRHASADDKKAAAEYVDFCTIGSSIAGLAGLGAGATFQCDFINGKFGFKIAASLCFGLGAKGAFICEVGYEHFKNFASWLIYQLFALNYHYLEVIAEDAFKTFTRLCVLQVSKLKDSVYEEVNKFVEDVEDVNDKFNSYVSSVISDAENGLSSSRKRNQLADNINSNPLNLLDYTPEAKGILLYLLTRHGVYDHFDHKAYGPMFEIYASRKKAIINILHSIQTKSEWNQIMQHRTYDGSTIIGITINEVEQEIRAFLDESWNRSNEFDELELSLTNELDQIYARIKTNISWGYALVMNNTQEYFLNTNSNPYYPNGNSSNPLSDKRTYNV